MEINDWFSLISLITAIVALGYTFISNKKRYELTYQYYNDVLAWHEKTVRLLIALKGTCCEDSSVADKRNDLLCDLSSQIEIGRFYFPNIDKGDTYGKEKPSAYKGYRNVVLDFLVFSYQLFSRDDYKKYKQHAETLQRLFTSHIYVMLNPHKHNEEIIKNTFITKHKQISIDDFIKESPETIYTLFAIDSNKENWEKNPMKRHK